MSARTVDFAQRHGALRERLEAQGTSGIGDQEQHRDVRHEPAHRIHEAVVAVLRDEARDAEEGRG